MLLPGTACPEREQAIIDLVSAEKCIYSWATVTSVYKGHTAEFYVFADALKVPVEVSRGDIKNVRANVSAETQQKIANILGCYLLTAKLADLIWAQRTVTLPPFTQQITSSTQAMIGHSFKIDDALVKANFSEGLVSTVGKHWIIDNVLENKPIGTSCNYGWHFEGQAFQGIHGDVCASLMKDKAGQYVRLIQSIGTCHNLHHTDYSQICVLVSRPCVVDGNPMNIDDVFADPELAYLVNHTGKLRVTKQPGV